MRCVYAACEKETEARQRWKEKREELENFRAAMKHCIMGGNLGHDLSSFKIS